MHETRANGLVAGLLFDATAHPHNTQHTHTDRNNIKRTRGANVYCVLHAIEMLISHPICVHQRSAVRTHAKRSYSYVLFGHFSPGWCFTEFRFTSMKLPVCLLLVYFEFVLFVWHCRVLKRAGKFKLFLRWLPLRICASSLVVRNCVVNFVNESFPCVMNSSVGFCCCCCCCGCWLLIEQIGFVR